jgi:glycine/D-amino acid oxidase-like deaminating enzyme
MALNLETRILRRGAAAAQRLEADLAVLGAGIAGVSAALEAAALSRRVILIDSAPALGGQSVGSMIGTFCGLYSNGPAPRLVTHGIAERILADLGRDGALHPMRGRRNTVIVQYKVQALGRWIEAAIREAGVVPLLSAVLRGVEREGRRLRALELATRYGDVRVEAPAFVDASGDAALAWNAGLPVREPTMPLYGTLMFTLEDVDRAALAALSFAAVHARLRTKGAAHGLRRADGFVFAFPGEAAKADEVLVNMTHIETPLDPVGASRMALEGRDQADRLVGFLRAEFPAVFARARVRAYGLPGIRQTRWIEGRHHLTTDEVRRGVAFADRVARCSWPIELHDHVDGVFWEEFGDDHMHYVPLGAMLSPEADNLVAAGRCIDGDPAALSSVRVMGPCIAMGAAAAHALDLMGSGAVDQIDIAALQRRLAANLES